MRILGVDPGTRRTGIGVIEASGPGYSLLYSGVVTIDEDLPIADKLRTIFSELTKILTQFQPDTLALENIFYSKNIRSMLRIGEARACAMLAASNLGIPVVEYLPTLVKQSVSGNGRAAKEQVQGMVKVLLNLKEIPPTDAADALAVAICHHHQKDRKDYIRDRMTKIRSVTQLVKDSI